SKHPAVFEKLRFMIPLREASAHFSDARRVLADRGKRQKPDRARLLRAAERVEEGVVLRGDRRPPPNPSVQPDLLLPCHVAEMPPDRGEIRVGACPRLRVVEVLGDPEGESPRALHLLEESRHHSSLTSPGESDG